MRGGRFRARLRSSTRRQLKRRWCREKALLALLEATHVGFIFRDPSRHRTTRKFSRFGHLGALYAHLGGKKQHQFLLLFQGQRFRRRFNFSKFAHLAKLSEATEPDNNPIQSKREDELKSGRNSFAASVCDHGFFQNLQSLQQSFLVDGQRRRDFDCLAPRADGRE